MRKPLLGSDLTIATDRPSVTNSSAVVPQGGFQAENGLAVTNSSGNYVMDLPETSLRYGLLRKTELRFLVPNYFQSLSSGSGVPSGFADLSSGVKQQIGPLSKVDLSVIVFLSFPSGAEAVSSHGYDPVCSSHGRVNLVAFLPAHMQRSFKKTASL